MASGLLAGMDVTAVGAPQVLYGPPPAGQRAGGSVTFCNRTAASIAVRLAVTTGGAPDNTSWKLYDVPVQAAGQPPLIYSGIIVGDTQKLYIQAASAGITATFDGMVEADA